MIDTYETILKLLLGTLLGGIIGFERQAHGRPAGFRTQLLVCVACVLLMLVTEGYQHDGTAYMRLDPTRIAAGAMTGIGFLGAGVILKTGLSVQGLTTAACIWIVAAIGLAIGAGQYVAAIGGFTITFFTLWLLRIAEARMPRLTFRQLTVKTSGDGDEAAISAIIRSLGFLINRLDLEINLEENEKKFSYTVSMSGNDIIPEVVEKISALPSTRKIEIRSQ